MLVVILTDIEKRKSFADMKLAEVASGGQQWNFENLPEEPSTPCDEAGDDEVVTPNVAEDSYNNTNVDSEENNLVKDCNGHQDKSTTGGDENTVNNGQVNSEPSTTPPRPVIGSSAANENKPDPVAEIAPDLQVKIADLGNACWVVSCIVLSL